MSTAIPISEVAKEYRSQRWWEGDTIDFTLLLLAGEISGRAASVIINQVNSEGVVKTDDIASLSPLTMSRWKNCGVNTLAELLRIKVLVMQHRLDEVKRFTRENADKILAAGTILKTTVNKESA